MVTEGIASIHLPGLEVQIALRLEIPGDSGASVAINLPFEISIPWEARDLLNQYLYDGVHGGLALVDLPLPDGGILVTVSALGLTPPLNESTSEQDLHRIGKLLQRQIMHSVAMLWEGLEMQYGTELSDAR